MARNKNRNTQVDNTSNKEVEPTKVVEPENTIVEPVAVKEETTTTKEPIISEEPTKVVTPKSITTAEADKVVESKIKNLFNVVAELEKKQTVDGSQRLLLELLEVLRTKKYGEFKSKFDEINSYISKTKSKAFDPKFHHGNVDKWTLSRKHKTLLNMLVTVITRLNDRNKRKAELSKINLTTFFGLLDSVSVSNLKRYYDV